MNTLHQWIPGAHGNEEFWLNDDCYISFNPSPPTSFLYDQPGPPETALVVRVDGETCYLILEDDFRTQYEEAFKKNGGQGVLDLFLALRPEYENEWSTTKDWKRLRNTITGGDPA
jgi:hypothetical protein